MEKVLKSFLEDEVLDQEFYDGIYDFVTSFNIRCGEYECNRFIIKKMDHLNFILYEEYDYREDGQREIHNSISINKNQLVKLINNFAKKQGFKIKAF